MNPNNLSSQFDYTPDPDTGQLFKVNASSAAPEQVPDDPYQFAHRPDVMWHSSESRAAIDPSRGVHAGTLRSAADRAEHGSRDDRHIFHPLAIGGSWAMAHGVDPHTDYVKSPSPHVWSDGAANFAENHHQAPDFDPGYEYDQGRQAAQAMHEGHVLAYYNEFEDPGSVSIVSNNPEAVKSWSSPYDRRQLLGDLTRSAYQVAHVQQALNIPGAEDRTTYRLARPEGMEQVLGLHRDSASFGHPETATDSELKDWKKSRGRRKGRLKQDIVLGLSRGEEV